MSAQYIHYLLEGYCIMTGEFASGITGSRHQTSNDYMEYGVDETPVQTDARGHESAACSECGAVYNNDRWTWNDKPEECLEMLCPACHRIQNRLPAGILTVRGDCLNEHRKEIMTLIHNRVQYIGEQDPLMRVMDVECDDTEAVFAFTDVKLTREIGDALHQAYDGVLDFLYNSDDNILRVTWQR